MQRTHVFRTCDLDQGLNPAEATVTRTIQIDGAAREIDLCTEHANELGRAVWPFMEAGRPVGRSAVTPGGHRSATGRRRAAEIRAWAKEKGYAVEDRGRIPSDVVAKYYAEKGHR